jgi:CBS domain-containing protein
MLDIMSYFLSCLSSAKTEDERKSFLDCGYSHNKIFDKPCSAAANASKRNPYFDIPKEYSVQFAINTMAQRNLYRLALRDFKDDFGGMVTQATIVRFLSNRASLKWMGSVAQKRLRDYQLGEKARVFAVNVQDSLLSAFKKLADSRVGGIPVVDNAKRLVGVVSSSDFKMLCA